MKKIIVLLFSILMSLMCFAACSNGKTTNDEEQGQSSSQGYKIESPASLKDVNITKIDVKYYPSNYSTTIDDKIVIESMIKGFCEVDWNKDENEYTGSTYSLNFYDGESQVAEAILCGTRVEINGVNYLSDEPLDRLDAVLEKNVIANIVDKLDDIKYHNSIMIKDLKSGDIVQIDDMEVVKTFENKLYEKDYICTRTEIVDPESVYEDGLYYFVLYNGEHAFEEIPNMPLTEYVIKNDLQIQTGVWLYETMLGEKIDIEFIKSLFEQ